MKKRFGVIALLLCMVLVSAASCGGEDSNGVEAEQPPPGESPPGEPPPSPAANTPPIAVITASPESAVPGDTITLDGSASSDPDGDEIVAFAWTQKTGAEVRLEGADGKVASFEAPDAVTTIAVELVVTDSQGAQSEPAGVEINVSPPETPPQPPKITAIVVSSALGSDDPSKNGSYLDPVATIRRGIELASDNDIGVVYVMQGTYAEEVMLASNIELDGSVVSFDSDGHPTFAPEGKPSSRIQAAAGSAHAVLAHEIENVRIENFAISGPASNPAAYGLEIEGSNNVTVSGNSFETIGSRGAICRDVDIKAGGDIVVQGNTFTNSGRCDDYIGVSVDQGVRTRIVHNDHRFIRGAERYLKAVQSIGGGDIEVSDAVIVAAEVLNPASIVTAIAAGDTQDLSVSRNTIELDGAGQATGVLYRCTSVVAVVDIEDNDVTLGAAAQKQAGVQIICLKADNRFRITRNRLALMPKADTASDLRGIDVQSLLRLIEIEIMNNAVLMPVVKRDIAKKTAVYLSRVGAASSVDLLFNTFLVTGASGELHIFHSDMPDLSFSTIGNIGFTFGSNTKNSVFSLRSDCEDAHCARDIVTNLFNGSSHNIPVHLAYYYDTDVAVKIGVANECDQDPRPAECGDGSISREGNVIPETLEPSDFDFESGGLVAGREGLSRDGGRETPGVDVDINGAPRTGRPDIGAIEYPVAQ